MISLFSFLTSAILFTTPVWQTDFEKAKLQAKTENKLIVLNFSGSDWCAPCIRMHKKVFDSQVFSNYASKNLVLVNADFPRLKKNKLSAAQQKKNDTLAELYDKDGLFPLTILMDANGKVLKSWDGEADATAEQFTNDIKKIVDASH